MARTRQASSIVSRLSCFRASVVCTDAQGLLAFLLLFTVQSITSATRLPMGLPEKAGKQAPAPGDADGEGRHCTFP